MNSETLRELHLLWEDIQTHLDISQRKLEEEQRLSQNLMRQYQDSQRRIKILKILVGNSQQFADKIRAKEDSLRSVLYKSFQSIVNSSTKDSQLTSEEEEEDGGIAKSSESSATVELAAKEKERPGSEIAEKTLAVTVDVDDEHSSHADSQKHVPITTEITVEVDAHNHYSRSQSPVNVAYLAKEKENEKEKESQLMDIGCRFYPTDQELIACVANKVAGEATPKFIQERDLYGREEPQELFKANPSALELYFFTLIKKKFDTGTRSQRLVGNGTWKIQGTKDIYDDPRLKNKVIGYKKTLNFMHFKSKNKEDSWIMHEYTLNNEGRWAICRIKRGRDNNFGLASTASSLAQPVALPLARVPELPEATVTVAVPPASLKRPLEKDDNELERPNKRLETASDGLLQLALASESMVSMREATPAATTTSSDQGPDNAQQKSSSSRAFPKSCINFL